MPRRARCPETAGCAGWDTEREALRCPLSMPDRPLDAPMNPCPLCQKSDQTASVQAIVRSGSSETSGTGTTWHPGATGYVGSTSVHVGPSLSTHRFHSHSQTHLARELDLWLEQPPERFRLNLGLLTLFLAVLGSGAVDSTTRMLMFLVLLATVFGLVVRRFAPKVGPLAGLAAFGAILYLLSRPEPLDGFVRIVVLAAPVVSVVALGSWLWAWIGYRRRAPLREHLYQVWSRLLYCSRDHRVFDPETGMHTDPGDVNALLYAPRPGRN